jgi:hypothetical protein
MNRHFLRLALAAGLLVGSFGFANALMVCAPSEAGKVLGPARVVAPSGTQYTTNNRGCALVTNTTDALGLQAKGFIFDPLAVVAQSVTAARTVTLPAGAAITNILIHELSGGAVTGGVNIGTNTTSLSNSTVSAFTCAANCFSSVTDALIVQKTFSATAPQTLNIQAATSFATGPAFDVIIYYKPM